MSQTQVLETVRGCLEDPILGLLARAQHLAPEASVGAALIRNEINFIPWRLSGQMHTATQPNVMLRPGRWTANLKQANRRDAHVVIEVAMEFFDAETDVLQDNITIFATALAATMDGLRDYSDAHGGTVIDVIDPIDFLFGEFSGPASSGFTASIQIEERSSQ